MEGSLKSGTCPRCGSTEVYHSVIDRGERAQIVVSSMRWFMVKAFVCISCGHFEEFIRDEDLRDAKIIKKIKETWQKA